MPDAFGNALRDTHLGQREEPLLQRDGEETLEHPIEEFYFGSFDPTESAHAWIDEHVDGPLVDVGAGVGRDALYFQDRYETVAIEVSEALVETMTERGVADPRRGDMFDLPARFADDRFGSALCIGTQTGLAGSMAGLGEFLSDLGTITRPDGRAVLDGYDPTHEAVDDLLGYRPDPAAGLAHRVFSFEYDGTVDPILYFRLFSPARVREAAEPTPWSIVDRRQGGNSAYYRIALEKG